MGQIKKKAQFWIEDRLIKKPVTVSLGDDLDCYGNSKLSVSCQGLVALRDAAILNGHPFVYLRKYGL